MSSQSVSQSSDLHHSCATPKIKGMVLPVIEPMKLSRIAAPFDNSEFVFELKHDGFRCMAYIADGRCDLVSQRTNHYKRFESLRTALAKLKTKNAILDGEIVCLDSEGKSRFNLLFSRRAEPVLYASDLLWLNGKDLRQLPLIERKKRLRQLIQKSDCERIIYTQHIEMSGSVLYRAVCKKDLEGIVCKKKDGVYSLSGHWLKVLNPAYTQHDGRQVKFTAFQEKRPMQHGRVDG
jgi:bifunctional non-homologous end joining protein LigD